MNQPDPVSVPSPLGPPPSTGMGDLPPAIQPPADLGRRAARGLAWMMSQTIGVKIVSLAANVVLAWFLVPGEAGLVGMSYIVLSIAGIVQYIGMQDVLVRRQAQLDRWITPAFWMSLAVGLLGGGLTALAAPAAAKLLGNPQLLWMILLLAAASPFQTMAMVPQAVLAAQMRFRTSAAIGMAASIGNSALAIAFAAMGFGAYSMLLPTPIIALAQLALMWWFARPKVSRRREFHLWRQLIGDTGLSWGASVCLIIITTVDHIALMLLFPHAPAVIGIYSWSVNLSTQLLRLLANNLMSVLLPSLSKLQDDPARQAGAFLQAARMLAMLGIPACLLQAALAEPIVHLLYRSDWRGVGPVLQALSVGMAFYFVSGPSLSMMKAQGRFGAAFGASLANAAAITAAVLWAAFTADESDAAWRVSVASAACLGAFGPVYLMIALQPTGHGWRAMARVYLAPTAASIIAIGAGLLISRRITGDTRLSDASRIAVTSALAALIYPVMISRLDRETWVMALTRFKSLAGRK